MMRRPITRPATTTSRGSPSGFPSASVSGSRKLALISSVWALTGNSAAGYGSIPMARIWSSDPRRTISCSLNSRIFIVYTVSTLIYREGASTGSRRPFRLRQRRVRSLSFQNYRKVNKLPTKIPIKNPSGNNRPRSRPAFAANPSRAGSEPVPRQPPDFGRRAFSICILGYVDKKARKNLVD